MSSEARPDQRRSLLPDGDDLPGNVNVKVTAPKRSATGQGWREVLGRSGLRFEQGRDRFAEGAWLFRAGGDDSAALQLLAEG